MGTSNIRSYTGLAGRDEVFDVDLVTSIHANGSDGNDIIGRSTGDDYLIGGLGSDVLNGDSGNDILIGDQFSNDETVNTDLRLAAAADIIRAGAGNDIVYAGGGNNYVNAGEGDDQVSGGSGNEMLQGGSGNDVVYGLGGDDILMGGTSTYAEQNAFVSAHIGAVLSWTHDGTTNAKSAGTTESRYYLGLMENTRTGADTLDGGAGNDRLFGQDGVDTLIGGAGNDLLDGGTGIDSMEGGTGNDSYYVDSSLDELIELAGTANGKDAVFASVSFGLAADNAIESLATASKAGTTALNLTGNDFDQMIGGNNGANVLNGLGGSDVVSGNAGNDRLFGGLGNDRLAGGLGNDMFVFDSKANSSTNHDTIVDFRNVSGDNDTIALENAVYTTLATGGLGGAFAVNATGVAAQADDRIIYSTATGNLYYDVNGSAAGGSILFASLTGHPTVTASDFVVI